MATKERLIGLFDKKRKIIKGFMKTISDPRFGIASGSLQESTFTNDEKLGKIYTVLAAVYCKNAVVELKDKAIMELVHELSHPITKVFSKKYKQGRNAGLDLKSDLDDKLNRIYTLGFKPKELFGILKTVNKFLKVAGGDESVSEDDETDDETTTVTGSEITEEELSASVFITEADEFIKYGNGINSSINDLNEGVGQKVKDVKDTVTDELITEAKNAVSVLNELNITLFINETKSWEKYIPQSALSDEALQGKLELLESLRVRLNGLKEVKKRLVIDCSKVKAVEDPMKMTKSPLAGESPEFFLRRMIDSLKSTTDSLRH